MAFLLKYNPFVDNFDYVIDTDSIEGVIRPKTYRFTNADLDGSGNLIIDISLLGAAGISGINIKDNSGNNVIISVNINGNIITAPIGLGILGDWYLTVSYWL